jgi:hypothetical protein
MADVEINAFLIEDARKRHTVDPKAEAKAAILTRILLAGAAVRCWTGAAGFASMTSLQRPRRPRQRRLLASLFPAANARRYHPLRLFVTEFMRWTTESAHRIPPILVIEAQFGKYAPRDNRLQFYDEPDFTLAEMSSVTMHARWIDPLALHDRWKPQFMLLCEKLAVDLEKGHRIALKTLTNP